MYMGSVFEGHSFPNCMNTFKNFGLERIKKNKKLKYLGNDNSCLI